MSGPPEEATGAFLWELERQRRLVGLRVDTLTRAVLDQDDTIGWTRLTELGTRATIEAQQAAIDATRGYMQATLAAAGVDPSGASVPIRPGVLGTGADVRGTFAATRDVVTGRVAGGATFAEAIDASASYLVGRAASEPHRIGRDGQLEAGLHDDRFDRFRRVAEPGACDFCRSLSTRGAVYLTRETAAGRRPYHPHCRCRVELVVIPPPSRLWLMSQGSIRAVPLNE